MSSVVTRLYFFLPSAIKDIVVSVLSFKNGLKRKGGLYKQYVQNFEKSWYYSKEQLAELQTVRLKSILLEAFLYSEHYRKEFKRAFITDQFQIIKRDAVTVLQQLPLLKKETLKSHLQKIESHNPARKRDMVNFTSGTTGTPMVTYYDEESLQISFALWRRFHTVIGLPKTFRSVRLSGKVIVAPSATKPPYWVYNIVDKQLFMSTYHLTENRLPHYIKKLESFKPQLIDGYPSAVFILAKYINANNIKFSFTPIAITTTAETLYSYQRQEIEHAFGCKVYNQYSSSEGGAVISECTSGRYHLNLDSGYFEFLTLNGEKAKPGEMAELIITSFRNYRTPLLRYETKDLVLLAAEYIVCNCGCHMPVVGDIIGREDDILFTEEKGYVGRMDTAYKGLTGIELSQIVQRSPEHIDIYQVVNEHYSPAIEAYFVHNLRERLGQQVAIEIHAVDNIPLSKNGKFKAVIREFPLNNFRHSAALQT